MKNKISDTLLSIGKNVKRIRKSKGMTQQELAFFCGNTDRSTISNIERFNCNGLNISTIVKIAVVLDVDLKEIFEHEKAPNI